MKYLKLLYLSIGVALLIVIVQQTDLEEVWRQVTHIGWIGIATILGIYFLSLVSDVWAWQLTFKSIPFNLQWLYRLFLVRVVGEALNQVTPMASLGGEPIKIMLLKTHYQIGSRESGVSLVLAKTIDTLALVVFLNIGFFLLLANDRLSETFKLVVGLGLGLFSLGIILFFLFQRFQLLSLAGRSLNRFPWGKQLAGTLDFLRDTDEQLTAFYARHRHFSLSLLVAFINWPLGAVEMYCLMFFLGHPVSFADAWIIEAIAQLVRAGVFFIPASLGTQEGTLMLICSAITGNAAIGLAVSIVQRFRELIWILIGLVIGWLFSLKTTLPDHHSRSS